jgi:hypothetical protein
MGDWALNGDWATNGDWAGVTEEEEPSYPETAIPYFFFVPGR